MICTWYHRRMLERKRLAKLTYQPVAGDEADADNEDMGEELRDIEAARPSNEHRNKD